MKKIIFTTIFSLVGLAQGLPIPGIISAIDVNSDDINDIELKCIFPIFQGNITQVVYAVYSRRSAEMIMPASKRSVFSHGEYIFSDFPLAGGGAVLLTAYFANNDPGGWIYTYLNLAGNLNAAIEGIAGFRLREDDGYHVGWVRFTRPDTNVQTPFAVADWDYNPVPNAPIGAGLPPEVPVTTEVLPENSGLRLSWPAGVASWILESTTNLMTSPLTWEPYPAGGTYADVPLDGEETHRFFRLRRP